MELFTIDSYIGEANFKGESLLQNFLLKEQQKQLEFGSLSDESFFIATADSVVHFRLRDGKFYPYQNRLKDSEIDSMLSCCYALRINLNNPSMKAFANEDEKVDVVLTGHTNGSVFAWENDQLRGEVCKCKGEILSITSFDLGVIIVTDSSYLILVTANLIINSSTKYFGAV